MLFLFIILIKETKNLQTEKTGDNKQNYFNNTVMPTTPP